MAKRPSYLTERQKEILDFILEFQRRRGISPTHREICDRFGYSSYGTVYKHLKLLQEKGYLRREWNQKRGIEVVGRDGDRGAAEIELPYFGRIAAGRPIEALSGSETLAVPPHLLGGRRAGAADHYVLEVVGDSMIDEGIHEGDLVVVQRRERADPGEMVVALIGDEATLKRFYPEGASVRLQPANRNLEPIRVPAGNVRVQGIVVGLMRRF
jgi:repressor LexA